MGQFMVKNQGIGTRKFCGKKVQEIIDLLNSIEPGGGEMIDQQTKILTILNTPLRG